MTKTTSSGRVVKLPLKKIIHVEDDYDSEEDSDYSPESESDFDSDAESYADSDSD
jgi:hypothetical protein